MKSAKERFGGLSAAESFQRVDPEHPLDLYCGYDHMGRRSLVLLSSAKPSSLASSKVIEVCIGKRMTDGKRTLSFSLVDNTFRELFYQFCDDMIDASKSVKNPLSGPHFLCTRYLNWQEMLSTVDDNVLSESVIKGLVGEMLFLRDILIPKYGRELSLQAWMGLKWRTKTSCFLILGMKLRQAATV